MKLTGVYCGSFNPVHKGHVRIARQILKQGLCDEILVVPTESYWNKNDLLPVQDRIRMWKMYENERIIISESHNELVRTFDLFEALKKDDSSGQYALIMGGDNLAKFGQWYRYEELLKNPFIIIKRDEISEEKVREIMKSFGKDDYSILDIENIDISATDIRDHLDDWDYLKGKIDKKVYNYYCKALKKQKSNEI